jgi:hypothetical protein
MVFYCLLTIPLIFDLACRIIIGIFAKKYKPDKNEKTKRWKKISEKLLKSIEYCFFAIVLILTIVKLMCFRMLHLWWITVLLFALKVYSIYDLEINVYIIILEYVLDKTCFSQFEQDQNRTPPINVDESVSSLGPTVSTRHANQQSNGDSGWKIKSVVKVTLTLLLLVIFIAFFIVFLCLTCAKLTKEGMGERLKDDVVHLAVLTKFFMCPPEGKIVVE